MIYVRSSPPEALPVSLETFRAHTRRQEGDDTEDLLLLAYLEAAVAHLDGRDGQLGRCIVSQEWTAFADRPARLPCGRLGFRLELGPIRNDLFVRVRYWKAGELLEVDPGDFRVEQERFEEASVVLAPGKAWPDADLVRNAWRVDFTAGWGGPDAVPAPIVAAVLLLATDLDLDRSAKTVANLAPNPTIARLIGPLSKESV